MDPLYILVALLAVPIILLMWLRINAAQIFLSLCLGNILVEFIGHDAAKIVTSASANTHGAPPTLGYLNLILLLLPVIATGVIMIHSVRGGAKLVLNFLPALGVSLLTVLLAVPLLPGDLIGAITDEPLWRELQNLQTLILGISTLLSLFFLWLHRPKNGGGDEKHGKHH
ncbi:MAG TPA: hypothetical protein VK983_02835 [Candidatus Limnocylindrales bacterium]|nr:hypothetical protein [Candidatus Limnocylindrales bacterium]